MEFKAEEKSLDFCKSISISNISPTYRRISLAFFIICSSNLTLWLQLRSYTKKSSNFKNLLCIHASLLSCIIPFVSSLFALITLAQSLCVFIILSNTPALGIIDCLNYGFLWFVSFISAYIFINLIHLFFFQVISFLFSCPLLLEYSLEIQQSLKKKKKKYTHSDPAISHLWIYTRKGVAHLSKDAI